MIVCVNIDSKIPNLALEKIKKYYQNKGEEVIETKSPSLFDTIANKIFVSCVFTKNKELCKDYEGIAEIGGTGYDIYKKLPPEIESIKPRINWGFTTRGCIRQCDFCFVPKKEGKIRVEGDIYDIWDGKSKNIVIMDNNILALKNHFKNICKQLRKEKLKVDFNQGLDIRLLDDDLLQELKTISHCEYKFAWDNNENLKDKFIWLRKNLGRCTIFVLCGFKTSFQEDLNKLNILRDIGHSAYCMRYETVYKDKKYIMLARWVNQHHIFRPMTWEQFVNHKDNIKYKGYINV